MRLDSSMRKHMDEKALSLTEGMLLIVMYLQVCVGVLPGTANNR